MTKVLSVISKRSGVVIKSLVVLFLCCCVVTQSHAKKRDAGKAREGFTSVADLHVVDCLLPGQVRRLGNRTYLTARRPIQATAADCRTRGGEYVEFDRADYKTALKVWMPAAEAGDADAQAHVGEIFERGLGGEPNYPAALTWYRKSAEQGNTRAQFNLGTMYEQGLGVEKNQLQALNWYRLAWGLAEDDLMFASAANRERDELRTQLTQALDQKNLQLELLRKQLGSLEEKLSANAASASQAALETETLKGLIAQLEAQANESQAKLEALPVAVKPEPESIQSTPQLAANGPKTREPRLAGSSLSKSEKRRIVKEQKAKAREYKKLKLGRYFALLIGNEEYDSMEDLDTPLSDVSRAREILENKYGFTVFTVADGDNVAVMEAINDLNSVLKAEDNLLLFYAGHGSRLGKGDNEIGYWLPANAEQPPRNTYWVPNEFVTGHLSRLKAQRILVVSDSCYSGLLSSEPSFLMLGQNDANYSNLDFLKFKLGKKSRLLLTSGGDQPVLDGGGGSNSIFASAFLDELENNNELLSSPGLFVRIRDRVESAAAEHSFSQRPEFKTIKSAGHEIGDFFFVPTTLR